MAQFILKINLGNDEMNSFGDIERAIRRIPFHKINEDASGNVRDINGNTVGTWTVTK